MPKRNRPRPASNSKSTSARPTRWIAIGAIVLIAVVAVVAVILLNNNKSGFAGVPSPNGMSMGSADAPLLIEEYSDFQCPYCERFYREQEPKIIADYVETGKARLQYVPYSFIGPESVSAAEAAYCAADQNKFWEFHYQLFANQAAENSGAFSDANLNRYAASAGLNMPQFRDCYQANTYNQQVKDDVAKGLDRDVQVTPTFFVNGKGPFNSVEVFAEIEKALAGQ